MDNNMENIGLEEKGFPESVTTSEFQSNASFTKKLPIQKPILIAMIAFVLAAVICFGTILIYGIFVDDEGVASVSEKEGLHKNLQSFNQYDVGENKENSIVGIWTIEEAPDCGEYLVFENDGDVYYTVGSARQFGKYTVETVTNESGETYEELRSSFRLIYAYGGTAEIEMRNDNKNVSLHFEQIDLNLVRVDMPELELNPNKIVHASADELGMTTLEIDKKILGEWKAPLMYVEDKSESYVFYEDGTGYYYSEYIENYNGAGMGLEFKFQYTAKDGKLLLSRKFYNEAANISSRDIYFEYKLEKGKLIMISSGGTTAYEPVK